MRYISYKVVDSVISIIILTIITMNIKMQRTLGSIDRYKTVKDITIYNVQDDERDINFVLDCKNYRHHIDDGKEEWIEYNVSKIRTFVKRLHYSKVREFQYTLRNDPNAQIQSPMKISNIAIKYHVGDEVR